MMSRQKMSQLLSRLQAERQEIQFVAGRGVSCPSFHNPFSAPLPPPFFLRAAEVDEHSRLTALGAQLTYKEVQRRVVGRATENRDGGYRRIQGALAPSGA